MLVVARDRTEEMRRELAEADFISNAAHELRNPLAGISSAIEVLQEGAKDDPQALDHFLGRLAEDAERMNRLTQSLLTLARVESIGAGETEVVDVAAAVRDVVAAVEAPAPHRARRRGRARSGRQGRPDPAAPGPGRPADQRLQAHAAARAALPFAAVATASRRLSWR